MEIKNLQTFICVAETKSFTKAADQLNYAQSTVTVQIQQLEQELGYPLFDRIGKTVSLTVYGAEFLNYAIQILSTVDKAASLNKDLKQTKGVLRIGALESLLIWNVLKIVPKFKEEYPLLDIKLEIGHSDELIQKLRENQLDIVYAFGDKYNESDLKSYDVKQQELIFVCAAAHPFAKLKNITPKQLFSQDFILTESTGFCHKTLSEMARDSGFIIKKAIEADSIFAVLELVRENMGLAFLPECSVEGLIREGALKRVDFSFEKKVYKSQVLCHKNRWISPFILEFIEKIKEK